MLIKASKPIWLAILLLCLSACSEDSIPRLMPLADDAVVLAFGDSLTFGTGSQQLTESYPAVLSNLINRRVINAGIPGEVSVEGVKRLQSELENHSPELVILCHGGNDLIRKLDEAQLKQNLHAMISLIRGSGAEVVMLAVPKPGLFLKSAPLYYTVADEEAIPLESEILSQVESESALKSDYIHPNAAGYRLIAQQVKVLLEQAGAL